MYLTKKMLADKNDVSVATVSRILREMEESGNYPTAARRCGKVTIDDEAFDHFTKTRKRKRREEKVEGSD